MKAQTLSLLAGLGAPLILAPTASAAFVGIETVSKPNDFGLFVCNVYAVFDEPGDGMVAIAGTPNSQLTVEVDQGTFYQHLFSSDIAPNPDLVDAFPSLAFDTFVTIGEKVDVNGNAPTLRPTWPGFDESVLRLTNDGWAVTPDDPLGDAFNPDTPGAPGQVLIGQFSTADGTGIHGAMLLRFIARGVSQQGFVTFEHFVPAPGALGLLGLAALRRSRRRSSAPRLTGTRPSP